MFVDSVMIYIEGFLGYSPSFQQFLLCYMCIST
jgi:hypothetical protein